MARIGKHERARRKAQSASVRVNLSTPKALNPTSLVLIGTRVGTPSRSAITNSASYGHANAVSRAPDGQYYRLRFKPKRKEFKRWGNA